MEEEVTAIQAARMTGRSDRTIRRMIKSGQLPARQIAPNRYAIKASDLDKVTGQETGQHAGIMARLQEISDRLDKIEATQAEIRQDISKIETMLADNPFKTPATQETQPPASTHPRATLASYPDGLIPIKEAAGLLGMGHSSLHELLVTEANKKEIGLITNDKNGLQHYAEPKGRRDERIRSLSPEQLDAVRAWRNK